MAADPQEEVAMEELTGLLGEEAVEEEAVGPQVEEAVEEELEDPAEKLLEAAEEGVEEELEGEAVEELQVEEVAVEEEGENPASPTRRLPTPTLADLVKAKVRTGIKVYILPLTSPLQWQ